MHNTTPRQPKGTQDHNNQKKQQEYGDKEKHQDHNEKEKHQSSHSLFMIFLN
jgi:hypothetical protein